MFKRGARSRRSRCALVGLAALGLFCAWARAAWAYPQWQFSSGTVRCNQCHFAPAGGGLINGYGRDAAGDELSTFGGDGGLLHGAAALPGWLSLGGDLRAGAVAEDVQDPNGAEQAIFPMQADLYARVVLGHGFSVHGTGGFRGQVRSNSDLVPFQNYQPIDTSTLISREHYVMWQPAPQGYYWRVGRFFAPFGLRQAEHITYVRRDLGFNTLEESYNVSGGWVNDASELHATLFAPDFARHIGSQEAGAVVYYERRVADDKGAIAVQGKYASEPHTTKFIVGGVAKYFYERAHTLVFGEADFVHMVVEPRFTSDQFVGLVGASATPYRGIVTTVMAERYQEDVRVQNAAWTAFTGIVSWFLYAHIEAQFMVRVETPGGGDTAKTAFGQLHYYF